MFNPESELKKVKSQFKKKRYVVCQVCSKPVLRKDMVKHSITHSEF